MDKLLKVAQKYEEEIEKSSRAGQLMAKYCATLRGLAIIHQQAHWVTKSTSFYGDHLLYDRIYNDTLDHIDQVAEKTVGVFDKECMDLSTHIKTCQDFINTVLEKDYADNMERGLTAEKMFLDYSKKLYDYLKESGDMTLGIDDMIMSIANKHEEFVYLLKQAQTV